MLYAFLGALGAQLPLLLAYTVGAVLAFANRRQHPRAANFLLLAVGLSFLVQLLSTAFHVIAMPYYVLRQENDGLVPYAAGVIFNFGHAAAFGLLIAAVFAGRLQKEN